MNDCQWQSEPTLTEPAGESDSQTYRRLDARGMFLLQPFWRSLFFAVGSGLMRNSSPKRLRFVQRFYSPSSPFKFNLWSFLRLVSVRESNGSVVKGRHLTEPAGESDSQTSRRLDARGMFLLQPSWRSLFFAVGEGLGRIPHQNLTPHYFSFPLAKSHKI